MLNQGEQQHYRRAKQSRNDYEPQRPGDASDSQLALSEPAGYVDNFGDCDDTLAANNPDAVEVTDGVVFVTGPDGR